jgi:hypothetical protein
MNMFEACMYGDLARVKELVSKDLSLVNTEENVGWKLRLASLNGHMAIVAYLERQPVREVFLLMCRSRTIPHDLVRSLFTYFV